MKIGVTATQTGLTTEQEFKLGALLEQYPVTELHHGDCVGGDAQADDIARAKDIAIVIHPPIKSTKRAFKAQSGDCVWEPRPYLERNHDIVDQCDLLIALPKSSKEELRSGTWATVRYATKQGKPIIILPGGENV